MLELGKVVPVVPVVMKADTMTIREAAAYRQEVYDKIHAVRFDDHMGGSLTPCQPLALPKPCFVIALNSTWRNLEGLCPFTTPRQVLMRLLICSVPLACCTLACTVPRPHRAYPNAVVMVVQYIFIFCVWHVYVSCQEMYNSRGLCVLFVRITEVLLS